MSIDLDDPRLTAYALGELDDAAEIAAVESLLAAHPEAQQMVDEVRATGDWLRRELAAEPEPAPVRDLTIHRAVDAALTLRPHSRRWRSWGVLGLAASTLILGGTTFLLRWFPGREARDGVAARPPAATALLPLPEAELLARAHTAGQPEPQAGPPAEDSASYYQNEKRDAFREKDRVEVASRLAREPAALAADAEQAEAPLAAGLNPTPPQQAQSTERGLTPADESALTAERNFGLRGGSAREQLSASAESAPPPAPPTAAEPPQVVMAPAPTAISRERRFDSAGYGGVALAGNMPMPGQPPQGPPVVTPVPAMMAPQAAPAPLPPALPGSGANPAKSEAELAGMPYGTTAAVATAPAAGAPVAIAPPPPFAGPGLASSAPVTAPAPQPVVVVPPPPPAAADLLAAAGDPNAIVLAKELTDANKRAAPVPEVLAPQDPVPARRRQPFGRQIAREVEYFAPLIENPFVRVLEQPQSTFALDVDTASYAITRRYLMSQNALPPKDAVRVEEMVNAFRYDDLAPSGEDPIGVSVEIARSPWSADNRLARVALTGRTIAPKDRPRANLVFLIDVSGSMDEPDKLPLLKRGMTMLTEQLGEGDRVAIVTYSDTARVVLPPTRGDQRREILSALESLTPGGSTNGAGGLAMAYDQAGAAFIPDGANRVILASDGDFNVGETDNNALVNLIQEKAKSRIFLTVLGFGRGNLQDARLEAMADKGNGNYHYIDSPREARRVLVQQVSGTLVTVAKDVKLQVDFNPAKVGAYRLIGYENRLLPAEAFRDDTKDGGELGAGHAVCALYELVPAGKEDVPPVADAPQFVKPAIPANPKALESFVVKLAFKPPDGDVSTTREVPAVDRGQDYADASESFRWAAAVASFGQLLRQSAHRGTATIDGVLEQAESARGDDPRGEREAFLEMVRKAKALGVR